MNGSSSTAFLHPDEAYEVDSQQAQNLFPALAPVHGALYDQRGARVDGRLLQQAMHNAARSYAFEHRNSTVDRLVVRDGQVDGRSCRRRDNSQ